MLRHAVLEQSMHTSEVAFTVEESHAAQRWRIFPRILLTSGASDHIGVRYEIFYSTEDGGAKIELYSTPEAFVSALVHRLRQFAGSAPQLRSEHRLHPREVVRLSARLVVGGQNLAVTILNRSRDGLMIELHGTGTLPPEVTVYVDTEILHCRPVWQDSDRAGLAFMPKD